MSDHERFVLLAARQVSEALSAEERDSLEAHLAACPECRSIAAGMRRDDMRLRAELGGVPVAPRVRRRVLDEATGRRRVDARLVLVLAAALVLAAIGVPLIAGGRLAPEPPPVTTQSPVPAATPSPPPSASEVAPSVVVPSLPPSPTGSEAFVAGAYTYGVSEVRRDTVAAHVDGGPVGEWSRTVPATGAGETFAGSVTCLEISGSEAWMAGPVTMATDGTTGGAMMAYFHDGGPDGEDDAVVLWQSTAGQTLTTMTTWCENHFIPAGPFPLISGDVVVRDGSP
jgi:hypothetical protein